MACLHIFPLGTHFWDPVDPLVLSVWGPRRYLGLGSSWDSYIFHQWQVSWNMLLLLLVIAECQLFSDGPWIESHVYSQCQFQKCFHDGRMDKRGHYFLWFQGIALEWCFPWSQAMKLVGKFSPLWYPLNSKRSKGTEGTEGHDKCRHRLLTREDDNIHRHPTPELPLSRVDSRWENWMRRRVGRLQPWRPKTIFRPCC